jgi:predicted nucleic acid-binding Zn ribbon protein
MKRRDAQPIGELVRHFLRQESLESPLNERRLINAWAEVLGPTIASYTREIYIKNQTLYVHLTSAPLRQELMMGREMLVRTLNRHVGAQVIANIVIR